MNIETLSTFDASVGRDLAFDSMIKCGSPGQHRDRVAIELAQLLIDEVTVSEPAEAAELLSGCLAMLLEHSPELKPHTDPHNH